MFSLKQCQQCQLTSGLHFSAKPVAKKPPSKVEKGLQMLTKKGRTESALHRKEDFQQVNKSVLEKNYDP